jgi:hypothetical protein
MIHLDLIRQRVGAEAGKTVPTPDDCRLHGKAVVVPKVDGSVPLLNPRLVEIDVVSLDPRSPVVTYLKAGRDGDIRLKLNALGPVGIDVIR